MTLNLLEDDPQRLTRDAALDDLLAAVRGIESWTDRQAAVLDHVYRNRLARQFRIGAPVEELSELLDHLQHVAHPRRSAALDALDKPYAQRWRAYADLLETQLAVLEAGVSAALLERAHVAAILSGVRDGRLQTQRDVQQHCHLQEANASRVLALLDAAELVLRQRHGRENRLAAGPRLPAALQMLEESGRLPATAGTTGKPAATPVRRGSSHMQAA